MRITFSVLLIILSVGIGFGQKSKSLAELEQQINTYKYKKDFYLSYNADYNRTYVSFHNRDEMISNGDFYATSMPTPPEGFSRRSYFGISLGFEFQGDALTESSDDFFLSMNYSGSQFLFPSDPKLIALIDGQSIEIGKGRIGRYKNPGHDKVNNATGEHSAFNINREELQRIAAAKSVRLKLGNFERKLTSQQIKMFRDILNLSEVPN